MQKKILVIGDSHSLVFEYINQKKLLPEISFITKAVHGASSQGVINPNSKTNSLQKFKKIINKNKSCDYIAIMLGEVDCGFTIWYYAENFQISIQHQLERSLTSYISFLENEILTHFKNEQIIIVGSILPTIKDQTDKRLLKGSRSKVNTPLSKRTSLTLDYNTKLQSIARKKGMHYIDITQETYNPVTKTVDDRYRNSKEFDHHLNSFTTSPLWTNKIKSIIK